MSQSFEELLKQIEDRANLLNCGCGRLATIRIEFPHGGQNSCQACLEEYNRTSEEINRHEMEQFGGAYGLCPVPNVIPLDNHARTDVPKLVAALREAIAQRDKAIMSVPLSGSSEERYMNDFNSELAKILRGKE